MIPQTISARLYTFDTSRQELVEGPRFTYRYDNNGNMIGKINKSSGEYTKFEYSSENQLVAVYFYPSELSTSVTKEVYYSYDSLGRRIRKAVIDHSNLSEPLKTFTRQYAYDGQEMHLEFDGQGAMLARYTHSSLSTDDVLAIDVSSAGAAKKVAANNGTYLFLKDNLGTIKAVSDVGGNVVQKYSYSVFGTILGISSVDGRDLSSDPVLWTHFAFTGREFDLETLNYYYRARYYDASIGRFLQQDPYPGTINTPISTVNKFTYAHNLPTGHRDPTGRDVTEKIFATLIVATVVIFAAAIIGAVTAGASITAALIEAAVADAIVSVFNAAILSGLVALIPSKDTSFGDRFLIVFQLTTVSLSFVQGARAFANPEIVGDLEVINVLQMISDAIPKTL